MLRKSSAYLLLALVSGTCAPLSAQNLPPSNLPEGPGKDVVSMVCNSCHSVARVQSGYSPQGWNTVLRMMSNHGLNLSAEQAATVREYLVKHFPEQPKPAAQIVPGPVQVRFQAWAIPGGGDIVRNTSVTAEGAFVLANNLTNEVTLVTPLP